MNKNYVTIEVDGILINTDEKNLSNGQLVVVQIGDIIPADLRLVDERGLVVDEFEITGELLPVHKQVNDEIINLYMGSKVVKGIGKGIVIAIGEETEYGKILKQKQELTSERPISIFQARYLFLVGLLLPAFGLYFAKSAVDFWLVALSVIWSGAAILLQNDDLFQHIVVHRQIRRLAHLNVQVSDSTTFERLWKMDILGFDKTGVLTTRDLKVKHIYLADGSENVEHTVVEPHEDGAFPQILIACAMCHDVLIQEKVNQANPIDRALIEFAENQGVVLPELWAQYERIYDAPFEPENRSMACGYRRGGDVIYYIKGDPDVILNQCKDYLTAMGERKKVDTTFWNFMNSTIDSITKNGDTAIALACASDMNPQAGRVLSFLCLIQLENSLQPGAINVIQGLKKRGIRILLLTGDRLQTAIKVSQTCGIAENSQACLSGRVIDTMGSAEVIRQSQYCSVFARLNPSQKGYLIRLFQQRGCCVGMIGDGPNDGIALRVADISISFTKNSSFIARQFSKILLPELVDLLTLVEAADRAYWNVKVLKIFRLIILIGLLMGVYFLAVSKLW